LKDNIRSTEKAIPTISNLKIYRLNKQYILIKRSSNQRKDNLINFIKKYMQISGYIKYICKFATIKAFSHYSQNKKECLIHNQDNNPNKYLAARFIVDYSSIYTA